MQMSSRNVVVHATPRDTTRHHATVSRRWRGEAERQLQPMTGEQTEAAMRKALTVPQHVAEKARALLAD